MNNRLIILAGGASSRMKASLGDDTLDARLINQANTRSKSLIEIGNSGQTLLDYLLSNAHTAGYTKVFIITGKDASLFRERYVNHKHLEIQYATQYIPKDREKPLGTADAVLQTMEQYPELQEGMFSVCNSDNLYSIAALKSLRNASSQACIAYDRTSLDFSTEKIARFAIMQFDTDYHLLDIVEKPEPSEVESCIGPEGKIRVSMNIFAFDGAMSYSFFKACPVHPERNEKEIPTVITSMLKVYPFCMIGIPFSEHVPDLTRKADILKMANYLKNKYI